LLFINISLPGCCCSLHYHTQTAVQAVLQQLVWSPQILKHTNSETATNNERKERRKEKPSSVFFLLFFFFFCPDRNEIEWRFCLSRCRNLDWWSGSSGCLFNKREALSSSPSTWKEKENVETYSFINRYVSLYNSAKITLSQFLLSWNLKKIYTFIFSFICIKSIPLFHI
jgi:hypothetical protein